ncbi:hypothetical protein D3C72_2420190 [compost metagenome]
MKVVSIEEPSEPTTGGEATSQIFSTLTLQTGKSPKAKSFNCAVVDAEVRVMARKLAKHWFEPNRSLTLMPPSKKVPVG